MFQTFLKMSNENKFILVILVVIILIALFYPRSTPLISTSFSAHLGNVGGKIELEAFGQEKTFALFYAPWCPHCKSLIPIWDKLISANKTDVKLAKIDCESDKDTARKFGIESFPTIYFLPTGLNNPENRIEYKGDRSGEAFLAFIQDK